MHVFATFGGSKLEGSLLQDAGEKFRPEQTLLQEHIKLVKEKGLISADLVVEHVESDLWATSKNYLWHARIPPTLTTLSTRGGRKCCCWFDDKDQGIVRDGDFFKLPLVALSVLLPSSDRTLPVPIDCWASMARATTATAEEVVVD